MKRKEAKIAENWSERNIHISGLPNLKHVIVKKKKKELTTVVVKYAGSEIVFKSYSIFTFEPTHLSMLPC